MLSKIVLCTTGGQLSEAARQATICGPKCGNWPAKTADECTFCPYRNMAWDHISPLEQAQLRATRPDMCPKEGEKE